MVKSRLIVSPSVTWAASAVGVGVALARSDQPRAVRLVLFGGLFD
jgi:hypothetical protein